MFLEYCLVPTDIINKVLNSDINIINSTNKKENIDDVSNNNFITTLKNTFKKKNQYDKIILIYNWMVNNISNLSVLENGIITSPLKDFDLIQFFKDIISNKQKFVKERINIFRIFTTIGKFPLEFIDNKSIKNMLSPNSLNIINDNKRKYDQISSLNDVEKKKRKKKKYINAGL